MTNRLSRRHLGVFLVVAVSLSLALAGLSVCRGRSCPAVYAAPTAGQDGPWHTPASGSDASKDAPAPPAASKFEAFTFLHFGDPQIGFGRDGIQADKRRFIEAIRQANERKPAFVHIAGDLVHKGTPAEYAALDDCLKRFAVPVNITPGNHDVADHATLKAYRAKYGRDYFVHTHNNCDFVLVNSMLLSAEAPWFKEKDAKFRQEIDAQWQWLAKALADAQAKRRTHVFLLTHVPPFLTREDEKAGYSNLPQDARARLLALCRKHAVRSILAGHRHRTVEIPAGDVTIYVTGGTARVGDKRGFGYRVFTVHKGRIEQEYVRLAAEPKPATAPSK